MNIFKRVLEGLIGFGLGFVVSAIVTYLYSLIVHSEGVVKWETAIQMGIILGILIPWLNRQSEKKGSA